MKKILWILLFISSGVKAQDLGCFGQTFEIIEPDLIERIHEKLKSLEQSGKLKVHQLTLQQRIIDSVRTPQSVEGLRKTIEARTFTYDPSITVPYDLKDHQGIVFAKAGTTINPLETHALSGSLLFIDGSDPEQVDWALRQKSEKQKVILVKGSPFLLMKHYGTKMYFDQGGVLIAKLGIRQVPAQVFQKGKMLQIEEILLESEKHEN